MKSLDLSHAGSLATNPRNVTKTARNAKLKPEETDLAFNVKIDLNLGTDVKLEAYTQVEGQV